jgi:UDP:flavonoid glycosyltransferase YjiC (YdhE family)
MRVLMSTWGWRSHFHCLAPLGWALQAAGHEVRVASHPAMAGAISSAGLAAVPLGGDLSFAEAFAGMIGRVASIDEGRCDDERDGTEHSGDALVPAITADGGVVRFAEAMLGDLVAFGRHWRPDLLVWEPFNLAAAVASAALGVPGVHHLWGPDSSVTLRLDPEEVFGPLAGAFGLSADEIRLTGDVQLDPVPSPLQVRPSEPSQPIRFVPYNGTAVLPDWLRAPAERPRVCVTAGTMMAGAGLDDRLDPLAAAIAAAASLDVEVVVVVEQAQRARLGSVAAAENIRLADTPLALRLLLPSCAAIVHQGGAGTMMTALAHGVPQLILPQVSDQHFNAERLTLSGAGTSLDNDKTDISALRDTLCGLLADQEMRGAASGMRDRVRRMPAPSAVVPFLEAHAARA